MAVFSREWQKTLAKFNICLWYVVENASFGLFDERCAFQDDWYLTRALLNGTNAIYVDIGRHYVSTNGGDELSARLANAPTAAEPIFGHFRPAEK